MIEELRQENFAERVIDNPNISVIDFYDERCVPCRLMTKTLERLSNGYNGHIDFFKVNVRENATLATDLRIAQTPTVIFFKDLNNIELQRGVAGEKKLREKIEALLGG